MVLRRQKLDKYFQKAIELSFKALLAQLLGLISVCCAIQDDRKLAVSYWVDFLTRMMLCVVIKNCIRQDIGPIKFSGAMISLNLLTHRGTFKSLAYIMRNCRRAFDNILLVVIPVYILTIDSGLTEGGLDLVMDFTALYILCDIDQLMALRG